MSQYIIKRNDGKFWAGPGRWSAEYPDAFVFSNHKNATQEAQASTSVLETTTVIGDYGTDLERDVATINGEVLP